MSSIVRLAQRDRVFIPIRANVDQLVPVVASRALEEASHFVDFRFNGGKEDFQPTFAASPHRGLRRVNGHHSAAMERLARRNDE